ncbi:PRTRC system protein B [Chryseobacterium sp. G0201]|uniref:PRTRC system protein B n=1 Tax=Chryseobacterium sp. G0201 TaxID=2487065 RepID=UPI000F511A34|nr:PRTRC system protein B [Chryseobacterium sp. G0201]AZA54561.1 PRTRC system protein B [Chryseobacterium sp. G0201]
MDTSTDLTENFGTLYHPKSALVFYQTVTGNPDCYVESFDMDKHGNLINAHPLTLREASALAKSLTIESTDKKPFLKSDGVIDSHILQVDPMHDGIVIWYSKAQLRNLLFIEKLGIPNGKANLPPLLWIANRNRISVYALNTGNRPTEKTPLYHAPFFNVNSDGAVCMGTVDVNIKKTASLEEFTTAWENYFFNSYFSHLMPSHNPINGNLVSIFKKLIHTDKPFPKEKLIKTNRTLKNVLR